MNIYQLRYYIAVVEEGTISAAARKLNLSQPPLSTQIKLLEEEVGTELFIRGARHREDRQLLSSYKCVKSVNC